MKFMNFKMHNLPKPGYISDFGLLKVPTTRLVYKDFGSIGS